MSKEATPSEELINKQFQESAQKAITFAATGIVAGGIFSLIAFRKCSNSIYVSTYLFNLSNQ